MTRKQYIEKYHNHKRRERLRNQRKAQRKAQVLDLLGAILLGLVIGGVFFFAR